MIMTMTMNDNDVDDDNDDDEDIDDNDAIRARPRHATQFYTKRFAAAREPRPRCNLSSVREGTKIKKMMMISSVLKFLLGNVSITKLISKIYLAILSLRRQRKPRQLLTGTVKFNDLILLLQFSRWLRWYSFARRFSHQKTDTNMMRLLFVPGHFLYIFSVAKKRTTF